MADPLNWAEKLARQLPKRIVGKYAFTALKLLGIEIPLRVRVGKDLRLAHGAFGLVIHESTIIGDRVKIFSGVTIGRADQYLSREQVVDGGGVVIGDDVVVGSGAKILFKGGQTITIGNRAVIGANAVLTQSVPTGEIWAGIPARRVSMNPNADEAIRSRS